MERNRFGSDYTWKQTSLDRHWGRLLCKNETELHWQ